MDTLHATFWGCLFSATAHFEETFGLVLRGGILLSDQEHTRVFPRIYVCPAYTIGRPGKQHSDSSKSNNNNSRYLLVWFAERYLALLGPVCWMLSSPWCWRAKIYRSPRESSVSLSRVCTPCEAMVPLARFCDELLRPSGDSGCIWNGKREI